MLICCPPSTRIQVTPTPMGKELSTNSTNGLEWGGQKSSKHRACLYSAVSRSIPRGERDQPVESFRIGWDDRCGKESEMFERVWKFRVAGAALLAGLTIAAGPVRAQTETSLADLLAGTAVPLTIKLKDLTPEWRRVSISGEAMLGMGGMQSMMQGIGSMFGGRGASDAI